MNYKEIEYKYWASYTKENFLSKIEYAVAKRLPDIQMPEVKYVVSCDDYYNRVNGDGKDFVRFRKGGGMYELTLKRKEQEKKIQTNINYKQSSLIC